MRKYSSTIPPMKLAAQLNAGVTTISLDYNGLPVVASPDTLTLVIDPDTTNEEIVTVTAHTSGSSTATITRGSESTADITHTNEAVVKHMVTARDLQEPHKHIIAKNYTENGSVLLHGLGSSDGNIVGTDATQTLKYKTLSTGCVVPQDNVTGLASSLAGKAASSHSHAIADVTDLQAGLDLKAPITNPTLLGTVTLPSTTSIGTISSTELGYLEGVSQSITLTFAGFDTRLDNLEAIDHKVRTGSGSVSVGPGTSATTAVTFGTSFGSGSAPKVMLTLTSSHNFVPVISYSSPSITGFTFRVWSPTGATVNFDYLAVQE